MKKLELNRDDLTRPHKAYRKWLLMQAQMQQDYADSEKAISLLKLVEAVYGADLTTGLMLCRAWSDSGMLEPLEEKVNILLAQHELSGEQRAAIYYCLSVARWNAGDRIGARKAHRLYASLMTSNLQEAHEKSTD
ncbi:hypothetical protein [Motilimonas pumila]|uniref:Uncharacterized protein n=1 Tax=Motilimonas pumila TaxID=2303987 RepID=A0A418YE17_9GAMM|nr:hypothetical protein [Motilimonas pumila]RJG42785.1 hypothetical protein D1Z90_11895 [Motilimonas pumila]